MTCANYNAFITTMICLMLVICCLFVGSLSANEPAKTPEDMSVEQRPLHTAFDAIPIDTIEYYVDTAPVTETTPQYDALSKQSAMRVADKLSRYAIQQSIKALYATQQYSQIQAYAQVSRNGIVLTYHLTSFDRIKAVVIAGIPPNLFRSAIENAIKSKPDGRYVPAIAKADISNIKQTCREHGYFEAQVTVADTLTEEGVLTYQIVPGEPSIIKTLQIHKNFAISANRLKAVCNFSIRTPVYNRADVDTDVAAMETLYRKNNYPTATIQPKFIANTGVLQFHVEEGKKVEFNFVSDTGVFSISQQANFRRGIAELISTGARSIWERKIKGYFENQGYHGTTVLEEDLEVSTIQLTIDPGMQYRIKRVTFSDNRAFTNDELLQEMTMKPTSGFLRNLRISNIIARLLSGREQKRFFYEDDLEKDEHRLNILYEKAGYPNAVIDIEATYQNRKNRNIGDVAIHVKINENYKEVIHRCTITDNRAIETATLLERLESKLPLPQPHASFEKTIYQNAVVHAYRELGYIDIQVDNMYIPEKPVFTVAGDFSEVLAAGELPSEIHDEFKKHNLTLAGLAIATEIDNRWFIQDIEGNSRYTLQQKPKHLVVSEHGILQLTVEKECEQAAFGKFYFRGDTDVVKWSVLEREVAHLEGDRWRPDRLSRALQNLYGLGIFRAIEYHRGQAVEKIDEKNAVQDIDTGNPHAALKTNDVLITVRKQKPRTYRYGGGYSFAEGWRGSLELTDSNFLFKRNIRGRFLGRLGWRDELGYLVDARLTEPWLINRTRGTLQVSAKKLEVDDYVRALQTSFILSRKLAESHHLDLRYSYRDLTQPVLTGTQEIPTAIGSPEKQNPFSTTVSSLRLSWTYDGRVRYLNAIGGMLNEVTLEYAGGFLQGGTSFIKTTTDTRYYQKLVGRLVLATAVRSGITTGLHSNRSAELISFERFWAGGSTTVRGYAERSLGPEVGYGTGIHRGDVQFIFKTELRFPIYSVIHGALFFDAGNVWDSFADIETLTRLPSAVGTGLYLDFGALTVGLDYAIPLVPVPSSPDTRRIHFRVGSPL